MPAPVVASNLHRVPQGSRAIPSRRFSTRSPPCSTAGTACAIRRAGSSSTVREPSAGSGPGWRRGAASRSSVAGRRPERGALAADFGARYVDANAESPEGSADIAVDCTGDREVWERLPELVRPGGQVLLFGGCAPGATVTFDAARLHYAEITLAGSFHYAPADATAALAALASGEIDPRGLLSERGDSLRRAALSRRPGPGAGNPLCGRGGGVRVVAAASGGGASGARSSDDMLGRPAAFETPATGEDS